MQEMSEFIILDKRKYPIDIEGTSSIDIYYEWEHTVTLKKSDNREFMILMNHKKQDFIIIETTEGKFIPIVDKDLILSITLFSSENNLVKFGPIKFTINGLSK